MELSVLDLVPSWEGADPGTAVGHAVTLARTAEKLGFVRYWVAEHHDMPGIVSSCPEVLLAHIGARTERIRIGSGAVLLPYYKPYKVAEAFHMLATLYPGRIDLGIGRAPGGSAHVSMALADNYLEQVRRLPESVEALAALLADAYRVDGQPVTARPLPDVPPELWLLGTGDKSAKLASRTGAGFAFGYYMSERDGADILNAYRNEYAPSRLAPRPKTIVAVGVVCAETEAEARRLAAAGLRSIPGADAAAADGAERPAHAGRAVVGTPEQVRAQLLDIAGRLGADEIMAVTAVADYAARLRSYELLAEAVQGPT
ncbi:MsnO8 family LLM class oxidoreductase [Paenibacillus flagellatus]|uniref:MsnO8 family LLM class oxidoreductase n=1 Tax=Paenibacillus flagellatus TaxID=2211139 RepID=UPI001FE3D6CD|nr:MsnO8 family LLM class oxidoreductase [Paenibacillus flagellatus]